MPIDITAPGANETALAAAVSNLAGTTGVVTRATSTSPAITFHGADLSTFPGVVRGVLADSAARTANGAALQAALNWCGTNGVGAYLPRGRYEYICETVQAGRNVGLQVPRDVPLQGGGSAVNTGTRLIQYAVNHPVLTYSSLVANEYSRGAGMWGVALGHGVSQTGQTSADGLLIGECWGCKFDDILVNPGFTGTNPAYIGLHVGATSANHFFSNLIGTIIVWAGQSSIFRQDAGGTGSVWGNLYLGGGGFGNRVTCSGHAVHFSTPGSDAGSFGQLNIEWISARYFLYAACDGLSIAHFHQEGCQMTGFDPALIHAPVGRVHVVSMKSLDLWIGSGATGVPRLLSAYGDSRIMVDHMYMRWGGSGYNAEAVASVPFRLYGDDTTLAGRKPFVTVGHLDLSQHTGAFSLDPNTAGVAPGTAGALGNLSRYEFHKALSRTEGATITMANAAMTVYGQHRFAKVLASVTLTASRTLTLSNMLAATGAGSTLLRSAGDIVHVHRTATGAFDLIVADHLGATIGTIAAAGTELAFGWTGTAWTAL